MSKRRKKKQNMPEDGVELLNQLKEETEVKEKAKGLKKIGGAIKGFFGSTAGKVVTVITIVGVAGATIYKVVFADGHEEFVESLDQISTNDVDEEEDDETSEDEETSDTEE